MRKSLGLGLVWIVLLSMHGVVHAQDLPHQQPRRPQVSVGFSGSLLVEASPWAIGAVEAVPIEMRSVPSHPGDWWIYGFEPVMRTIPSDSVGGLPISNTSIFLAPELTVWRIRVRSGVSMAFSGVNDGKDHRLNQFGTSERGTGMSLVYYNVSIGNTHRIQRTHEADIDIGKDLFISIGMSRQTYAIDIDSGYDRWNALTWYQRQRVADVNTQKIYAGLGWQIDRYADSGGPISLALLAGRADHDVDFYDDKTDMRVRYGAPWFFSARISVHIRMWNKR